MHRLVSSLWLDLNGAWTFTPGCFRTMARCTAPTAESFWWPERCLWDGSCCQHMTPRSLVRCHLGCRGIHHLYVLAGIWIRFLISLQFSSIHRHWTLTTLHQALYKAPNSLQPLAEAVHLLMGDPNSGSTTSDLTSSYVVGIWPSINLFLTKPNKNKKVNWICLRIWNKPQLIKCFCWALTLAQVTFLMKYRMKNHKKCTWLLT